MGFKLVFLWNFFISSCKTALELAKERNYNNIIQLFTRFSSKQKSAKILNTYKLPDVIVMKFYEIFHKENHTMNPNEIDDLLQEFLMCFF